MEQKHSKILIIGPSWIGDMVMAQSLFIKLKELYPDSQITVTAPNWSLPLLQRMPEVTKAVANTFTHGELALWKRRKLGKELEPENYDLSIVLPNSFKSALVPFFANIKSRRGLKGEQRYILLNQMYKNIKQTLPLMVQRYVACAFNPNTCNISKPEDLGHIQYPKLTVNLDSIPDVCRKLNIEYNTHTLGICPGAEYGEAKRWPAEYYAEIIKSWIKSRGVVCIFGSGKDQTTADKIVTHIPEELRSKCFILTGKTSLTEAIDLLAHCEIVVTNDSGLMHVTAAVGTPLIAVYGSSTTGYTPPLSHKAKTVFLNLECRPCFKRECPLGTTACLRQITPEIVLEKLNEALNTELKKL
ncbi:MAG: lipopolysaccharide heptosyltransferase II [Succinivibrionaceae bacterium]|nr:lipopolysaccharide heptosyltransferase II [Succinivibrionaceae bacterium]